MLCVYDITFVIPIQNMSGKEKSRMKKINPLLLVVWLDCVPFFKRIHVKI